VYISAISGDGSNFIRKGLYLILRNIRIGYKLKREVHNWMPAWSNFDVEEKNISFFQNVLKFIWENLLHFLYLLSPISYVILYINMILGST
jgi:hypothetical protein